jgi:dTDP-glucose 4,6-dehydratase
MPNPLESDLDHVLEHTRELWEELRGQRVFITGGTGFIGCWLLETFAWANRKLNLGASALVLTRNPDVLLNMAPHLFESPEVHTCYGDIRTFAPPKGEFTHAIHAASAGSADPGHDSLDIFRTTVYGTDRVLASAEKCQTKKLLFTSSGAMYGKQPCDLPCMPEDFRGAPDPASSMAAYAESKRAAETLCAIFHSSGAMGIKIARCFAFVGPYLPLNRRFAIGNFIRDEMAGGPIRVRGDGTDVRSYLYSADLAIWLWTILFKGRSCDPYNVGSEKAISIAETARTVAEAGGHGTAVEIEGGRAGCFGSSRYVPSTRKARIELNLQERIDLRTAVQRTMEWHVPRRTAERPEGLSTGVAYR